MCVHFAKEKWVSALHCASIDATLDVATVLCRAVLKIQCECLRVVSPLQGSNGETKKRQIPKISPCSPYRLANDIRYPSVMTFLS